MDAGSFTPLPAESAVSFSLQDRPLWTFSWTRRGLGFVRNRQPAWPLEQYFYLLYHSRRNWILPRFYSWLSLNKNKYMSYNLHLLWWFLWISSVFVGTSGQVVILYLSKGVWHVKIKHYDQELRYTARLHYLSSETTCWWRPIRLVSFSLLQDSIN